MMQPSKYGVAALLAGCLSACSSAPTRLYTLYPVPSLQPKNALAGEPTAVPAAGGSASYAWPAVRLDAVHLPPALDRAQVVSDVAPGELKINDLEQWSAPLGEIARQTLAADLSSRLPAGRAVSPHLPKPAGALGISVDVLDFHTDARGAHLEAGWGVVGPHVEAGLHQRAASLTVSVGSAGPAADRTAETFSLLLGQLADRIVADLAAARL